MGLVIVLVHGSIFEGAIHPFNLAIRPRMMHLGQSVLDAVLTADTLEEMTEGVWIAASVGQLEAVVGQYGQGLRSSVSAAPELEARREEPWKLSWRLSL